MAQHSGDESGGLPREAPSISVHEPSRDRVVFTEADNTDGWIATDYVVSVLR